MKLSRAERFEKLSEHYILSKSFKRLKADELEFCRQFIRENEDKDDNEFAAIVNRLGVIYHKEEFKIFKHGTDIWGLLSQCFMPKPFRVGR